MIQDGDGDTPRPAAAPLRIGSAGACGVDEQRLQLLTERSGGRRTKAGVNVVSLHQQHQHVILEQAPMTGPNAPSWRPGPMAGGAHGAWRQNERSEPETGAVTTGLTTGLICARRWAGPSSALTVRYARAVVNSAGFRRAISVPRRALAADVTQASCTGTAATTGGGSSAGVCRQGSRSGSRMGIADCGLPSPGISPPAGGGLPNRRSALSHVD